MLDAPGEVPVLMNPGRPVAASMLRVVMRPLPRVSCVTAPLAVAAFAYQ